MRSGFEVGGRGDADGAGAGRPEVGEDVAWDVRREIDAGLLAPGLPNYSQPADVWAVYPSRLSVSAKVRVCVEFLEEWFAQTGLGEG